MDNPKKELLKVFSYVELIYKTMKKTNDPVITMLFRMCQNKYKIHALLADKIISPGEREEKIRRLKEDSREVYKGFNAIGEPQVKVCPLCGECWLIVIEPTGKARTVGGDNNPIYCPKGCKYGYDG